MATSAGEVLIRFDGDDKGLKGAINTSKTNLNSLDKHGSTVGNRLKGVFATVGKAIVAGLVVVSAAVVKIVADSVKEFAKYEQAIGGTAIVFGDFATEIEQKAHQAYKNMGTSATQYMETANKMASLFQGSGISQQESLNLTTQAMQRAADVASAMGISTEMALESIAGAAKGNFTMMDNLGVAMNATTLEAYALEKGVNFKWMTASNADKARLAMEMFNERTQQFDGNFAREAEQTISGAFGMMKASWADLLVAFASGDENMLADKMDNLVSSIGTLVENMVPVIQTIVDSLTTSLPKIVEDVIPIVSDLIVSLVYVIVKTLPTLLPEITNAFVEIINLLVAALPQILPALTEAMLTLFTALVDVIPQLTETLIPALTNFILAIVDYLPQFLPQVIMASVQLFMGIIQALPEILTALIAAIPEMITALIETFPELIPALIVGAVELFMGLVLALPEIAEALINAFPQIIQAFIDSIPRLADKMYQAAIKFVEGFPKGAGDGLESLGQSVSEKIMEVINGIGQFASDVFNAAKNIFGEIGKAITDTASSIWSAISSAISGAIDTIIGFGASVGSGAQSIWNQIVTSIQNTAGNIWSAVTSAIQGAVDTILGFGSRFMQMGSDLINGLVNGIKNAAGAVWDALAGAVGGAIEAAKRMLGIASPSKVFKQIGKFVMDGLKNGIKGNSKETIDAMKEVLKQLSGNAKKTVQKYVTSLNSAAKEMDKLKDKIADQKEVVKELKQEMAEYAAAVKDSFVNFGSISSLGEEQTQDAYSILQALKDRAKVAKEMAANIATLQKKGLNQTAIEDILSMGVEEGSRVAAALAQASEYDIGYMNYYQGQIEATGVSLGKKMADSYKKAGVNAAQGLLDGLQSREAELVTAMEKLADKITAAIKKALKIKSPSRVFMDIGDDTGEGFNIGFTDAIQRSIEGMKDILGISDYKASAQYSPSFINNDNETANKSPLIGQIIVPDGADPMAFAQQIGAQVRFA
jgi:phage-related protein